MASSEDAVTCVVTVPAGTLTAGVVWECGALVSGEMPVNDFDPYVLVNVRSTVYSRSSRGMDNCSRLHMPCSHLSGYIILTIPCLGY